MKRIKAACLEQTVHFQLKDDLGHAAAARAVKEEYEHYKMQLERSRTRYKIVEETVHTDIQKVAGVFLSKNTIFLLGGAAI